MQKLGFKHLLCAMLSVLILLGVAPISTYAEESTEPVVVKNYTVEEVVELIKTVDYEHLNLENVETTEVNLNKATEAYNSLSDADKATIDPSISNQLIAAARRVESLKEIKHVINLINEIGEVTLESESKIVEARTAYDALKKNGKNKIKDDGVYKILEDAEAELAKLKEEANKALTAQDVIDLIDAIDYKLNLETMSELEPKIVAARDAYEALTDEEKAKVPETKVRKLMLHERQLANLKDAKKTIDLIDAIGEVNLESESKIVEARTAFDALNKWTRKHVADEEDVLKSAEGIYSRLKNVVDLIDAIEYKMNLENMADVELQIKNARDAYEALTDEEKAKIPESKIQSLLGAERQFAVLKNVQKTIDLIDKIGDVTLDSEQAIKDARESYDALGEWGKKRVTNYDKLVDAEAKLAKLKEEQAHKEEQEHKNNNNEEHKKPTYKIVNTCTK